MIAVMILMSAFLSMPFTASAFDYELKPINVSTEEGYVVVTSSQQVIDTISDQPELTIDHVYPDHLEVYGPKGLALWLKTLNVPLYPIENPLRTLVEAYPSYKEIASELKTLAECFPDTAKVYSIGKSVEGRPLLVLKISRNVNVDDGRPEFKYIANMHGDEVVGRELLMKLSQELLEKDGKDPVITKLLDDVQIHILVSMNPDGAARQRRGNVNYVDLNRNFPDFTTQDNRNTPAGRAPETQAVMRWQQNHHFCLSANFHGGAEVVNYPWDAISDPFPLEAKVKRLSLHYANLAKYIGASQTFRHGITNGYAWYKVKGGMQDWSYHWYNDLQLTIELSKSKWPDPSRVSYYYSQNRAALLDLIGQARACATR